jgi:hypothetical protein
MTKKHSLVPVVLLALAALACAVPNLPVGDGSLFKDDFASDSSGWGTGTDAESSVEYSGGEFVIKVFLDNYFVWSIPGMDNVSNVHVEATVKNVTGESQTAFGVICNHQVTDSYYYFAITSSGDYAIAKTAVAKDDEFLTNDNQWAVSDDITQNAASYRIGADCGSDGTLRLLVDGKQIASATDTSYTGGEVGLFVWTGEETNADIRFDDIVVTSLSQ